MVKVKLWWHFYCRFHNFFITLLRIVGFSKNMTETFSRNWWRVVPMTHISLVRIKITLYKTWIFGPIPIFVMHVRALKKLWKTWPIVTLMTRPFAVKITVTIISLFQDFLSVTARMCITQKLVSGRYTGTVVERYCNGSFAVYTKRLICHALDPGSSDQGQDAQIYFRNIEYSTAFTHSCMFGPQWREID